MILPSISRLRVANSTQIVDFDSKSNSSLVNRDNIFDFPTPESPIFFRDNLETIDNKNVSQKMKIHLREISKIMATHQDNYEDDASKKIKDFNNQKINHYDESELMKKKNLLLNK